MKIIDYPYNELHSTLEDIMKMYCPVCGERTYHLITGFPKVVSPITVEVHYRCLKCRENEGWNSK